MYPKMNSILLSLAIGVVLPATAIGQGVQRVSLDDALRMFAERNLEPDDQSEPIDNPLIRELFGEFERGSYRPRRPAN